MFHRSGGGTEQLVAGTEGLAGDAHLAEGDAGQVLDGGLAVQVAARAHAHPRIQAGMQPNAQGFDLHLVPHVRSRAKSDRLPTASVTDSKRIGDRSNHRVLEEPYVKRP